jgi:adenylate cyclase
MRIKLHFLFAFLALTFYGGAVCPFIDSIGILSFAFEVGIIYGIAWLIRYTTIKQYSNTPINEKVRIQFFIEIFVFLLIGSSIMIFNTLMYDFPLGSGVKVLIGTLCSSFFIGVDMALAKEREIYFQIEAKSIDVKSRKYGIAKVFTGFATITIILLTFVILLVVTKNYQWLQKLPEENLQFGIYSSIVEIFFVMLVFLIWIINLILSFSQNLKMFFEGESKALQSAMEGRFDTFVPVVRSDEFGTIASYTNEMIKELQEKKRIREIFGKIVSPEVSRRLLSGEDSLKGSEEKLVIVFSDVRNFTSISEEYPPALLIKNLNLYFTEMVKIIYQYGGEVDKFIGDGILAYFGLKEKNTQFLENAISASIEMIERSKQLKTELEIPLEIGIGMDFGDVIAGVVGSVERQEFTVMGTPVNTAARLEGLCKEVSSPLVISERVQKKLDGKWEIFIDKGEFKLKGKAHPERIFALRG